MVDVDRSGVIFTVTRRSRQPVGWSSKPARPGRDARVGAGQPEHLFIHRVRRRILSARVGHQHHAILRSASGDDETIELGRRRHGAHSPTRRLCRSPSWRCRSRTTTAARRTSSPRLAPTAPLYLVQSRPITTLGGPAAGDVKPAAGDVDPADVVPGTTLATGLGASPGVGRRPVRILASPKESSTFRLGDVLVAPMTTPDWAPIHAPGGLWSPTAAGSPVTPQSSSRELRHSVCGRRAGCDDASLRGRAGHRRRPRGAVRPACRRRRRAGRRGSRRAGIGGDFGRRSPPADRHPALRQPRAPEQADGSPRSPVDGVGLLRAEFLLTVRSAESTSRLIAGGRDAEFVTKLSDALVRICRPFAPRPVIYRTTDFRTNEFRGLEGGEVEPVEANPMIGYRGCYRYVAGARTVRAGARGSSRCARRCRTCTS